MEFYGAKSTPFNGRLLAKSKGKRDPDWNFTLDVPGISEILPGLLYQSGIPMPHLIKRHGIVAVFNMSYEQPVDLARAFMGETPPIQFVNPIFDGDITTIDLDRVHWLAELAAGFVQGAQPVLSHCQMGWNRSGLLTGLTLLELGFDDDVVAHIQKQRGEGALSNRYFAKYLRVLQETGNREHAFDMAKEVAYPSVRRLTQADWDALNLPEDLDEESLEDYLVAQGM